MIPLGRIRRVSLSQLPLGDLAGAFEPGLAGLERNPVRVPALAI